MHFLNSFCEEEPKNDIILNYIYIHIKYNPLNYSIIIHIFVFININ